VGMLGLMLGGMIFATASSVNTSLNLAAAVLTNDVFKYFKPKSSSGQLMLVARISTILFGIGTIVVALLVPAAGGIVEVVLSIGAVTGGSLYGPPIWGLFSRRLTGKAIFWITLTSLLINVFFKLLAPGILGISLDRGNEMMLGVAVPLILLAGFEFFSYLKKNTSTSYLKYQATISTDEETLPLEKLKTDEQNTYGIKVIAMALGTISLLFFGLSIIAQKGIILLILLGLLILGLAFYLYRSTKLIGDNGGETDKLKKKQLKV